LYCSEHLSLAALEVLVHLSPNYRHARFLAVAPAIPDDVQATRWEVQDLPIGWRTLAGNPECAAKGSHWAKSGGTLVLLVPSVVVPQERNLILNGMHEASSSVRVRSREPILFDARV
jgi:RES domain-containing protein